MCGRMCTPDRWQRPACAPGVRDGGEEFLPVSAGLTDEGIRVLWRKPKQDTNSAFPTRYDRLEGHNRGFDYSVESCPARSGICWPKGRKDRGRANRATVANDMNDSRELLKRTVPADGSMGVCRDSLLPPTLGGEGCLSQLDARLWKRGRDPRARRREVSAVRHFGKRGETP